MSVRIREAIQTDLDIFVHFTMELSKFNRKNHSEVCKYDDFNVVLESIKRNAEKTFENRDKSTLIVIAFFKDKPVGYALGRIFEQDENADNGTGRMGLFDELFLVDSARGLGIGKAIMDYVMEWFKVSGIHRIKLHAYSWNTAARNIYESNGFRDYVISYEKFI